MTGMNGLTPFFRLPYFNYMKHVGIDAMHNVLLGWIKEVTTEIIGELVKSKSPDNVRKVLNLILFY